MTMESRELALFTINDATLYKQAQKVMESLRKKIKADKYDTEKALILWQHHAEAGAKAYAKEFGGVWHNLFSVADRKEAAKEIAEHYQSELFADQE